MTTAAYRRWKHAAFDRVRAARVSRTTVDTNITITYNAQGETQWVWRLNGGYTATVDFELKVQDRGVHLHVRVTAPSGKAEQRTVFYDNLHANLTVNGSELVHQDLVGLFERTALELMKEVKL